MASAGEHTLSAAAGIGGAILSFAFTAFATFLLLRDGERLVASIPDLLPFERTRSEGLLLRIRDVVQASMYGVVAVAAVQGVLCGGMFWFLGVPAAALWGLVTIFASMVPFVGSLFSSLTITLLALASLGTWPAVARSRASAGSRPINFMSVGIPPSPIPQLKRPRAR